jgi:hypothetical protein
MCTKRTHQNHRKGSAALQDSGPKKKKKKKIRILLVRSTVSVRDWNPLTLLAFRTVLGVLSVADFAIGEASRSATLPLIYSVPFRKHYIRNEFDSEFLIFQQAHVFTTARSKSAPVDAAQG